MLIGHIGRSLKGEGEDIMPLFAKARPSLPAMLKRWLGMPARSYFARKAIHVAARSCRPPMATIASGVRPGDRQLFRVIPFDPAQTASIEANCVRSGANFRNSLFYLAATIRAMNTIITKRGSKPVAFVVPVPQDTRKRGARGPIIGNHITILFYRAEAEDLLSMDGLIKSLSRQMMDQMRNQTPESFSTMMELFRNLPIGLFALQAASPTKGQMATFFFSFPGELSSDLELFMGLPVSRVLHLPPISFPPGISVIFAKYKGSLSAVLSYVEGCLDQDEIALFESSLCSGLLNTDR